MPIIIPDSIASPIITCATIFIYSMIALSGVDKMAYLTMAVATSAINTEWHHLPALIVYIFAMFSAGFLVCKIMLMAFFKDRIEEGSDMSSRVCKVITEHKKDGSHTTTTYIQPENSSMMIYTSGKPKEEGTNEAENDQAKTEQAETNQANTNQAENNQANTKQTPAPAKANPDAEEITGPAEAPPTEPPAPMFGNASRRAQKRHNGINVY